VQGVWIRLVSDLNMGGLARLVVLLVSSIRPIKVQELDILRQNFASCM
jgi:hypothetical protein